MIVKATVAFAGAVTMAENEVRDVREGIAAPLVKCGYLIPVEDTQEESAEAPAQEEPTEAPAQEEPAEAPKKAKKSKKSAPEEKEEK